MKVCFFSPTAYSYFNPESGKWAGGAETQQILIARRMAERGIDVSFIVGDHGQPEVEIFGGITVIKSFSPFVGNRKLRFIPDMLKIRRAMQISGADIFNQRSTAFYTGQLCWFASTLKKRFVFSLGIDYNCYADCAGNLSFPMTNIYRYGIRNADSVIAQTDKQKKILAENMGRESILIRNGIEIIGSSACSPGVQAVEPPVERGRKEFIWVGSFRRRKRPDLFLELARQVPEADFTIIGGKADDPGFYEKIKAEAASIPNLDYPGFIEPDNIEKYYSRAFAYINTSELEGFPNTYLHSWRRGVPTFTIGIDPDRIIENNRIGRCTGTFERLVESVREILSDEKWRERMCERALEYVAANHDIRDKGDEYIRLFESLI
ncbi:MAG: glycosyltransferase family 4 protein [Candidatus Krumholzibacteriota bacterium]|nr:glycosyltransferase family 4 protein [Candidatus Krumholzibacteriota bacterium]